MTIPRFSINLIDKSGKQYRTYFFLATSEDIQLRIFNHALNFIKCSELPRDTLFSILNNCLTSLCHKINMVKYHLERYCVIEDNMIIHLRETIKPTTIAEGTHLIEMAELTAEYESFLFQMKSALDILIGFLNPIYRRKGKKSLLKKQVTFENKGLNVIKDIEGYLRRNPEDEKVLRDLVEYLKRECIGNQLHEDGSLSWIFTTIDQRDEIAHLHKSTHFAFQVNNSGDNIDIYPPNLTPDQTMRGSFIIAYGNLLIFVEDFIALLFTPYLNENFVSFTFEPEGIKEGSPRWYIMLRVIQAFGIKSVRENPYVLIPLIEGINLPIDALECVDLHRYYNGFYK